MSTTDAITNSLSSSLTGNTSSNTSGTSAEVSKNEFLQLLVTQLKHQDPLDPMKNEDFAVQLAQFSSLEQLVSINEKVGKDSSSGDFSSLASYLGHNVTLNTSSVALKNGDAGSVRFDLGSDAANVKVELVNSNYEVMATVDTGPLTAGRQTVNLNGLNAANGDYLVRITSAKASGGEENPVAYAAGMVSGFLPGANPALIVGGREVTLDDILEVNVAG